MQVPSSMMIEEGVPEGVRCLMEGLLSASEFDSMVAAMGQPPAQTCFRVNTTKISRDECINEIAQLLVPGSPQPVAHPTLTDAILLPGSGPYELPSFNTSLDQVIVDRACGEALLKGANVFAPGVLACSAGLEADVEVEVWAHCEVGAAPVRGSHVEKGVEPKGCQRIGLGRAAMAKSSVFKATKGLAVTMTATRFVFADWHGKLEGLLMLQGLPSLAGAHAVQAQKGDRVLDMCAAPGGKSTAVAQHMGDTGEVVALDRSHHKVAAIEALATALHLTAVRGIKRDATTVAHPPKKGPDGAPLGPREI